MEDLPTPEEKLQTPFEGWDGTVSSSSGKGPSSEVTQRALKAVREDFELAAHLIRVGDKKKLADHLGRDREQRAIDAANRGLKEDAY